MQSSPGGRGHRGSVSAPSQSSAHSPSDAPVGRTAGIGSSSSEHPVAQHQSAEVLSRTASMVFRDSDANNQAAQFGAQLWDCGTQVFAQANRGIRFSRRVGKLFHAVSEAHLECAKKIMKAVERAESMVPNYSHPSMASSIDGFNAMMRAVQSLLLAQNTFAAQSETTSRHIFDSFSTMETELKQLEKQHANLQREMKTHVTAHSEARKKFQDAVAKHKDLKESDKHSDQKLVAKIVEKEKEVKRREAEYKAATEALNSTREMTNGRSLPTLLTAIYCVEEQRIQGMRTGINQFGTLVRNQKIACKQIGDQIKTASLGIKAMDDLKHYMEAVATSLPPPPDEPVESYDVNTCKLSQVESEAESLDSEGGIASPRDSSGVRESVSLKEGSGLVKGFKSMFSGLLKKPGGAIDVSSVAAAGGGGMDALPQVVSGGNRRFSRVATKRFYGLSVDNHITRKYRGYPVPLIAATLMEFVMIMDGQKTQGIFRLSAPSGEMAAARNLIEVHGLEGDQVIEQAQAAVGNCIVAAVLLKTWLRELPDSIVPQRLYGRCVELVSKPGTNRDGVALLLQSLPRANLYTLKALALFLRELSESSSVTLMGLENFAIVFAPCWLRNPSDDPATLLVNASKEIAFAKEALALLSSDEFVVTVA